jgi:hypothetical protein
MSKKEQNIEQADSKVLNIACVTPRYIFDEGIKYAKELAEKNEQELNLDTCTMIASDYTKHVAHFLRNNVG